MDRVSDSFGSFMWGLYRLAKLGRRFHRKIVPEQVEKRKGFVRTIDETIDGTVFDRWRRDPTYRPPTLLDWHRRKGSDPAGLHGPVRADDGTPVLD